MSQSSGLESCAKLATDYQRNWIRQLRSDIKSGTPYALVNADTPHELFHYMGIPMITNQWWSALMSAKKLSEHYFNYMQDQGFHDHLPRYSSLALMAQLEGNKDIQPWGGLPDPTILCARQSAEEHQRIFSLWAEATGASLHLLSSPGIANPEPNWWEQARENWESLYGTDRLDLMVAELEELIAALESLSGKTFIEAEFANYMESINEQETLFEQTSTLIADAEHSPMGIAEQIPNVMIPQWHRGSEWAINHAKSFQTEIIQRIDSGYNKSSTKPVRMMWIGAGLWFDTSFYKAFEESHNAYFVWSMYLPFAADGYIRAINDQPLRSLAARVSAMNEQLHQPPWVNEWVVEQARKYRIDVALMLIPQHDRFSGYGSLFARKALENQGIKVIEVWSDMVDARSWDRDAMLKKVGEKLDQ